MSKIQQSCATILTIVASLCLAFMMILVVADIVFRWIEPQWRIFGMLDYVELSLDWLVFLAIPAALFRGQIIVVDIIDGFNQTRFFKIIGAVVTLALLLLLLSQVIRPALDVLEWREQTFDLGILKFYYWIPIWIGISCSSVAAFLLILGRKES